MTLGQLLALICIIIGFVVAAVSGTFLFPPTTWFIAAIAIVLTLGGVYPLPFRRSE